MKNYICAAIFFAVSLAHAAEIPSTERPLSFDFRGMNVAQAVQLIYAEALPGPFVIDPEVLSDPRTVSFRYESKRGDVKAFMSSFLDSLGLTVERKDGIDFVSKKITKPPVAEEAEVFVYRPKNRDGSYLIDAVAPLVKGQFTARRTVHSNDGGKSNQVASPPGSAAAMIDRESDVLVFSGSHSEVKLLTKILPQIDQPAGAVLVRGVLYEVQTTGSDGSAFGLTLNLLSGKLGLSLGQRRQLTDSISLTNTTIDAVLTSLSSDSRFTVKSTPTIRVQSGASGRFTVGQDVPVLGAVTYPSGSGSAVRSVEYRSSGVIFDLVPTVHENSIDINVLQQMSNFVQTDTGVNDSPTLIKRELKTALSLHDGEIVIIGGLAEKKETKSRSGLPFLPAFLHAKSKDEVNTEILLILQVSKV